MSNSAGDDFLILQLRDSEKKLRNIFLVIYGGQVVHVARSWMGAKDRITDSKRDSVAIKLNRRYMKYGFFIGSAVDSQGIVPKKNGKIFVIANEKMIVSRKDSMGEAEDAIKRLKRGTDAKQTANVDLNSNGKPLVARPGAALK